MAGGEVVKMEMEIEMGEHQGKQLLSLPSSPGRLSYRMRVTFVVLQLPGNLMLGNEEQHPLLDSGVEWQSFQPGAGRGKSHGFSRVAAGTWGIFSSYSGDVHSKL